MRKVFSIILILSALAIAGLAQDNKSMGEMGNKPKPTEKDKNEVIPSDSYLKRGAPIGDAKKVSLSKVLENPAGFAGKMVRIEGVIVRSCKNEGCWAEIAPDKDGKSVRVKMKDHGFFIPLAAAGSYARAEGVFSVKTLSKEQVDHMIKDDGAKFDKRNEDGTVTEVSFEASGIELKRSSK